MQTIVLFIQTSFTPGSAVRPLRYAQSLSLIHIFTKQGSVITVGAIAARCRDRLRCFKKNPAGCAERLYETIAQLRAALVTPEMLEEAIPEADEILAEKLKDIALVYREYLDFLSGGYLDELSLIHI